MTLEVADLPHLADELGSVEDLPTLWSSMVRFFRHAGFTGIVYMVFDRGRPGEISLLLRDGIPEHVHRGFIELGSGRHDVSFRYALATGRPSLRSQTVGDETLSRMERLHHIGREALDYGDSLVLPLYGPHNYVGIVSLGLPTDSRSFDQANWAKLHMAALSAHLRAFQLQPIRAIASHSLSEREMEVLCWVAQGKSNAVIGNILSIADGTVDTYLRRIFDKLDVADRTSAAVKGVSMGLIRL